MGRKVRLVVAAALATVGLMGSLVLAAVPAAAEVTITPAVSDTFPLSAGPGCENVGPCASPEPTITFETRIPGCVNLDSLRYAFGGEQMQISYLRPSVCPGDPVATVQFTFPVPQAIVDQTQSIIADTVYGEWPRSLPEFAAGPGVSPWFRVHVPGGESDQYVTQTYVVHPGEVGPSIGNRIATPSEYCLAQSATAKKRGMRWVVTVRFTGVCWTPTGNSSQTTSEGIFPRDPATFAHITNRYAKATSTYVVWKLPAKWKGTTVMFHDGLTLKVR